jgi:hypothetical protein
MLCLRVGIKHYWVKCGFMLPTNCLFLYSFFMGLLPLINKITFVMPAILNNMAKN